MADYSIWVLEYAAVEKFPRSVMLYGPMYQGTKKEGLSKEQMANVFIWIVVVAIVCSRLLYIATNPGEFEMVW